MTRWDERRTGDSVTKKKRTFARMSFRNDPIHMRMASPWCEYAHGAVRARHVYIFKYSVSINSEVEYRKKRDD